MPDDPETHLLYGTALSRTGSGRVAVWSLRKAAEDARFAVAANLELAAAQTRVGNWKEAIAAAESVLDLEPENLDARVLRGEANLSEGGEPEKAIADFDAVIDEDPTNLPALTARAAALLMVGRVDDAAETIDQIEALTEKDSQAADPQEAPLCAIQAVLRQERGKLEEAEKRFEECLERFPSDAVVVDSAITFFDQRGDVARSDAVLEKALELVPYSISYRRTLALRKEASGDSAGALATFEQGLETDDRELKIAVLTDLTNYHLDRDEVDLAVQRWEETLALVDDPPQSAILSHADLLARAGRHADALKVAENLENQDFVHLIQARISLDRGDPARALEHLDQVFPSWPNNAGARYYAARASEQLGDFARAVEEYRQSIRSAPDQTEAALRLAKLYRAGGALAECTNDAWQYVNSFTQDPEGARTLASCIERDATAKVQGLFNQLRGTSLWPAAVATRLRVMAELVGPADALSWLEALPGAGPDWTDPRITELLRERVRLQLAAGRSSEAEKGVAEAIKAHPESGALLEIRGMLLEATGSDPASIRAAFDEAATKDPHCWLAYEGLARADEREGDLKGALAAYDRATKLHPESPEAARQAARLAPRAGARPEEIEKRWADLLKEHPWDADAARTYAQIRLSRGDKSSATLDFAERGVFFGGGREAEKLLVAVHEARGETSRAKQIEKALTEGKPIPPRKANRAAGSSKGRAPESEGSAQSPSATGLPPSEPGEPKAVASPKG